LRQTDDVLLMGFEVEIWKNKKIANRFKVLLQGLNC
jgi:hypothetical protein